jgi:riboflavin synthase
LFTGLIKELGRIEALSPADDGLVIKLKAPILRKNLERGASVNINGACQTVINLNKDGFEVYASAETLTRTNFKHLSFGEFVNLELPLTLNEFIGGHLILGHIDCVGRIKSFKRDSQPSILRVEYDPTYELLLVEKGSIAVEGISLTCFDISRTSFSAAIIPETIKSTNLQFRKPLDYVNIEFDILAKYINKNKGGAPVSLTFEYMNQHGFEVSHD